MMRQLFIPLLGVAVGLAVLALVKPSFGALASASTGKAVTSANLSTNPTIRKQQLLVDPAGPDEPLVLTYARLNVLVQLDTPLGTTAQDIISSIVVTPVDPNFMPDPQFPLPFYNAGDGNFGVTFPNAFQVMISDLAVQYNPENPPPPGEVIHAIVDVNFNDLLPAEIYNNILSTYTVHAIPTSLIQGRNSMGEVFSFMGPDQIAPATDFEVLGAPEPTLVAPLALLLLGMRQRSRRHSA
jgi:hypothetical protein